MKIQKELRKEAVKQREKLELKLTANSTQRLLTQGGAEDIEMLKQMGMHTHAMALVDEKGRQLEVNQADTKYGQVYTKSEIKAICEKYGLRFLRSENYKGAVDTRFTQKIKEFHKDFNLEMNQLGFKIYLMAPYSAFSSTKKSIDPIAFYKLEDNTYRLIHQWGDNMSPWRQLIGWKYTNLFNHWAFSSFVTILPLWFVIGLFTQFWGWFFLSAALLCAFMFCRTGILRGDSDGDGRMLYTMNEIWERYDRKNAL